MNCSENTRKEEARQRYVTSEEPVSITELALDYVGVRGLSKSALTKASQRDGWVQQRRNYWDKVRGKAQDRMATKASYDVQKSLERTQEIEDVAYAVTQGTVPEKFGEAANVFFRANKHARKISGVDPKVTVELELGGLVDALKSGRG